MIKMLQDVGGAIDAIFYCTHTDEDDCHCRKPKIGMLEEIEKRFACSLKKIPAIGDSLRDLIAFRGIGAQPILVKTGNGEQTLLDKKYPKNTLVFENLFDAAEFIIANY
jgi:D-glycero-D-manno-heptose 1,7-bisphosphate phosphatase